MGCRITDHLKNDPAYRMLYVEPGANGQENGCASAAWPHRRRGGRRQADVVVLAVPDRLIGQGRARAVVPMPRAARW